VGWFVHYLDGVGPTPASLTLAHDPWDGTPSTFDSVPPTTSISVGLPGTSKLKTGTTASRSVRLTGGAHETFGDGTVTVRYSKRKGWDHLVATVTVAGQSSPATEGGTKIAGSSGVATIHLMNEAVLIPAGKKVTVTLSATSDAYSTNAAAGSSVTLGRGTLKLSVLQKAVSH
jgi:hypothetical protein